MSELLAAAKAQEAMNDSGRLMKRMLAGALVLIFCLSLFSFCMAIVANEASKDMRPKESSSSRRMLEEQELNYGILPSSAQNRLLASADTGALASIKAQFRRLQGGNMGSGYMDNWDMGPGDGMPAAAPPPPATGVCSENEDGTEECGEIGQGQVTTNDGLRVAVAAASTEKFGKEVFDYIFTLPPTEMGNIIGANIPMSWGPASFSKFQSCEKVGHVVRMKPG